MPRLVGQFVKNCKIFDKNENLVNELDNCVVIYLSLSKFSENINSSIKLIEDNFNINIMLCSQITLYAKIKSNKPSFHDAEDVDISRENFKVIFDRLKFNNPNRIVKRSRFREYQEIKLTNVYKTVYLEY
ncbi:hypothetical protein A0H76_2044 [Hepatospora eriocheir]|uniref:D-aminoacyl-tRNA deacylase n=1 Tax=Hepatospora eriocheir TaxID=1081669 RepID=A0A1X0QGA9_9MICR|nr:hypothetical protein A0H76_2044 [Hepatospora eriocheir]